MASISVGGLTVDQPWFVDPIGNRWTLTGHTGFRDGPPMRTSFTERTLAEGSYDSPAFAAAKVYVVNGTVRAVSPLERDRAVRKIRAVLSNGALQPVVYTDLLGALQAQVRKSDVSTVALAGNTWADFSLQLTAPSPRLIDVTIGQRVQFTQLAQPAPGGGVQFRGPDGAHGTQFRGPDGTSGLVYGKPGPSGIIKLDNTEGTADADIVFDIDGPVPNPRISTATNTLAFNGSLGAGDRLTIDSQAKTVKFNGASRRTLLSPAEWFRVPAGETLAVRFSASQQNAEALLTASYYVTSY